MKQHSTLGLVGAVGLRLGLAAFVAAAMPATAQTSHGSDAFDVAGVTANSAFGVQQNVLASGLSESPAENTSSSKDTKAARPAT